MKVKCGVGTTVSANGGLDVLAEYFHEKALHAVLVVKSSAPECFRPQIISILCGRHSVGLFVEVYLVRGTRNVLFRAISLAEVVKYMELGPWKSALVLFLLLLPSGRPSQGVCAFMKASSGGALHEKLKPANRDSLMETVIVTGKRKVGEEHQDGAWVTRGKMVGFQLNIHRPRHSCNLFAHCLSVLPRRIGKYICTFAHGLLYMRIIRPYNHKSLLRYRYRRKYLLVRRIFRLIRRFPSSWEEFEDSPEGDAYGLSCPFFHLFFELSLPASSF